MRWRKHEREAFKNIDIDPKYIEIGKDSSYVTIHHKNEIIVNITISHNQYKAVYYNIMCEYGLGHFLFYSYEIKDVIIRINKFLRSKNIGRTTICNEGSDSSIKTNI